MNVSHSLQRCLKSVSLPYVSISSFYFSSFSFKLDGSLSWKLEALESASIGFEFSVVRTFRIG